jgi:hypothetical protein
MAGREVIRPAGSRPDHQPKVRRAWQPDPRNVKALDRFIAQTYGREWVRRSRS